MKFLIYIIGLELLVLVAGTLVLLGYEDTGWIVGSLGTVMYLFIVLAWVAIYDSRKRWPDTTAWERAINVLSFRR